MYSWQSGRVVYTALDRQANPYKYIVQNRIFSMQTPEKNLGVRKNLYELEFRMMSRDEPTTPKCQNPPTKKRVTPILVRHYLAEGTALNPIVID